MKSAPNEMEEAIAEWLKSYEAHERYLTATETLFAVFARSWQGSRRHVTEAFADFREALLKEHRLRKLEVATAFPKQRSDNR
jgi:hypothetical protein